MGLTKGTQQKGFLYYTHFIHRGFGSHLRPVSSEEPEADRGLEAFV